MKNRISRFMNDPGNVEVSLAGSSSFAKAMEDEGRMENKLTVGKR
ncbi:hypothetical protein ACFLSA_00285 [Bacteroidota bacterium]